MKSLKLRTERAYLRYHDIAGSGPPLIFIHGLGCASSCDYPAIAADPALAGRRMLLVDLLGAGFSDRPAEFGYTIDLHARTIVQLVGHLGLEAVDLFGHSMGGAVAITAAGLLGHRVRRMVLSEPNLEPGGGIFSRRIAAFSEADYLSSGHDDLIRTFARVDGGMWAASLMVSAPYALHRGASSLVTGSSPSWGEQLAILGMPKTVIVGSASLPHPHIEQLPRSGVKIDIVQDAGHSMAWENPAGLAGAIGRALA